MNIQAMREKMLMACDDTATAGPTTINGRTIAALRNQLPAAAQACVSAIIAQVPSYRRGAESPLMASIASAVEMALAAFLDTLDVTDDSPRSLTRMRTGAYRLGQGEAETGRSSDALLSAYRVGAREAWSQFAAIALTHDEDAAAIAALASDTFTFIDDLSAQSLAGHTAAMTTRTRELTRRRDTLATALVSGENPMTLEHLAERAHWNPPRTLTALVLHGEAPRALMTLAGERTLWTRSTDHATIALLADVPPARRHRLLTVCSPALASLGPTLPWADASDSVLRARRGVRFAAPREPADTVTLLPELLLAADPVATQLLRDKALAPLQDLSETKRTMLAQTLLSWLMHQGRRDDVARELHVHPQTVRYRMNTLRELYGEDLAEPRIVLELTLGLLAHHSDARPGDHVASGSADRPEGDVR